MSEMSKPNKESTLQIRLYPKQKEIITRAAELEQTSISNFILEHAYKKAEEIVSAQTNFLLPQDKWDKFLIALDNDASSNSKLRKLLKTKGAFD